MLSLVPFTEAYFHQSGIWLNDPELMQLIDASPASEEDRRSWFRALPSKSNYLVWGVALRDKPIGVAGLKNIDGHRAEYFGYIGIKERRGNGYGISMINMIDNHARLLKIETTYLKVLFENYIAINLYFKAGYKIIGTIDGRLYQMEKSLTKPYRKR